jgi:chromosome segregation ATPase
LIESGLYILLGFIIAILMMLVVVPMIWRRAVRLTEKRVLGEIPISYSELQAEKDMQRAEQAITQRRLEVSVESQREQLTLNSIKIDRLKQTIEERDGSIADHKQTIANLESSLANKGEDYLHQTGQLEQSRTSVSQAKERIAELEQIKADLETDILHFETEQSEQKVELVAQLARIEAARGEISELNQSLKAETDSRKETESLLTQKTTEFDRLKERSETQEEKLNKLQTEAADRDSEIATLEQRVKRLQETRNNSSSDAQARLAETEARRVEAEAKISSLTLQLANQGDKTDDENAQEAVRKALEADNIRLNKQINTLQSTLRELHDKYDELSNTQSSTPADSPLTPSEHQLREEMKKIAAQVTVAAMKQEEEPSKIAAILEDDKQAKQDEDPLSKVLSLAGHITNLTQSSDENSEDQPKQNEQAS